MLIFYKYADLRGAAGDAVEAALRAAAADLSLRGRVRVADDGVNAALGGALRDLRALRDLVVVLPQLAVAPGERAIDFQARCRCCVCDACVARCALHLTRPSTAAAACTRAAVGVRGRA